MLNNAMNDELLNSNPLDRIDVGKRIKQTDSKSNYVDRPFDMD